MATSKYVTQEERQELYARDNHTCVYCEKAMAEDDLANLTLDHVFDRSKHPHLVSNHSNLRCCCRSCNSRKQDLSVFEFLVNRMQRDYFEAIELANKLESAVIFSQ